MVMMVKLTERASRRVIACGNRERRGVAITDL